VNNLKRELCRKTDLSFEALQDAILYENPDIYEELSALQFERLELDDDGGGSYQVQGRKDVLAEWLHPVHHRTPEFGAAMAPQPASNANGMWMRPPAFPPPPGLGPMMNRFALLEAGWEGGPAMQEATVPNPVPRAVAVADADSRAHLGRPGQPFFFIFFQPVALLLCVQPMMWSFENIKCFRIPAKRLEFNVSTQLQSTRCAGYRHTVHVNV
jgi:hypothetical protein